MTQDIVTRLEEWHGNKASPELVERAQAFINGLGRLARYRPGPEQFAAFAQQELARPERPRHATGDEMDTTAEATLLRQAITRLEAERDASRGPSGATAAVLEQAAVSLKAQLARAEAERREAAATITRLSAVLRRARPYVVDAMNAAEESGYTAGEEAASQLQDDIDAALGSGAGEGAR